MVHLVLISSLDVEGKELEVLAGLDFRRMSVGVFLIEYTPPPHSTSGKTAKERLHDLKNFFLVELPQKYPHDESIRYEMLAKLGPGQNGRDGCLDHDEAAEIHPSQSYVHLGK